MRLVEHIEVADFADAIKLLLVSPDHRFFGVHESERNADFMASVLGYSKRSGEFLFFDFWEGLRNRPVDENGRTDIRKNGWSLAIVPCLQGHGILDAFTRGALKWPCFENEFGKDVGALRMDERNDTSLGGISRYLGSLRYLSGFGGTGPQEYQLPEEEGRLKDGD